jgi:DNA-binding response OmpR family regulator
MSQFQPTPPLSRAPGLMIVIGEPLAALGKVLRDILVPEGHHVETFEDGLALWEHLDRGAVVPDLVLVDLDVPRLGALELLARVEAKQLACQVVVMTTGSNGHWQTACIQAGAHACLQKPFSLALLRRILAVLRSRKVGRPPGGLST